MSPDCIPKNGDRAECTPAEPMQSIVLGSVPHISQDAWEKKSEDLQWYVDQQPKSRKPKVLTEGSENTAVL